MSGVGQLAPCDIAEADLEGFAAGTLQGAPRRRILEHLLAGCSRCRETTARLGGYSAEAPSAEAEQASTARILARIREAAEFFDHERAEATELIDRFLGHPMNRRWTLIRNSHRYDTWSFVARLLDVAYQALYSDARETLDLAEMALVLVGRLDAAAYGQRLVNDLEARSLALRGNARRTLGDLRGAASDLHLARRRLEDGSGDPLADAELDYFEASWHVAAGDAPAALVAVRRSARLYRELGDEHLEGRSLNSEADILALLGRPAKSLERFRDAAAKVDAARDPHLALAVRHNLVWQLVENGSVEEALWQLAAYEREFERLSEGSALAKLGWLRARILLRQGETERGEKAYEEVIQTFAELELPNDAASAALDLCALYAEQGRWSELRQTAAESLAVLKQLGIASEAMAAWLVLQRAAERETATAALVGRLADYFAAARQRPDLRFEG